MITYNQAMSDLIEELNSHYQDWTEDITQRINRKLGWKDVTDTYYGILPNDWPYESRVVDPRVRTILIEKNSRLTGGRISGRVVPVENADVIKARIQQALLEYQWRMADEGGSMQTKLSISDMDARLYGSKFALIEWRVRKDKDGKVIYEGNEYKPLDIRDCGIDPTASHIRDAKWFQHRQWVYLEDLKRAVDAKGRPLFKNLGEIERRLKDKISDTRIEYNPRILEIQGREDRMGKDIAFPMIKIVTEYRKDRWITFSPTYKLILREIENPYNHGKIPIAQLRYHPIQDDPLGESEVEPVIMLWRAIQAVLCGYMDEVVLKMNSPLIAISNAYRPETINFAPRAIWEVDRPDAIIPYRSDANSIQYFQSTYLALVSALNTAMGAMSQGVSNIDPTQSQKTATEIRNSVRQQTAVDQKSLTDLGEFLRDVVSMWIANNQQFLFSDESKHYLIVKVIGKDNWEFFKKAGFADTDVPVEAQQTIADILMQNPDTTEAQLQEMLEAAKLPKNAVVINPREKNPLKYEFAPKLSLKEMGDEGDLYITKEDIQGQYDFIPDIRLMTISEGEERQAGRQAAIQTLTNNQLVLKLLQDEGYKPKIKELLEATLEDTGLKDPERFFEKINENIQTQGNVAGTPEVLGGIIPNIQNGGVATPLEAVPPNQNQQPMASARQIQQPQGIP